MATLAGGATIPTTKTLTIIDAPVSNTDAANKLYVDNKITSLVASAPATLDTLNELATALGNDANFSTTVTNLIGQKIATTDANNYITANVSTLNSSISMAATNTDNYITANVSTLNSSISTATTNTNNYITANVSTLNSSISTATTNTNNYITANVNVITSNYANLNYTTSTQKFIGDVSFNTVTVSGTLTSTANINQTGTGTNYLKNTQLTGELSISNNLFAPVLPGAYIINSGTVGISFPIYTSISYLTNMYTSNSTILTGITGYTISSGTSGVNFNYNNSANRFMIMRGYALSVWDGSNYTSTKLLSASLLPTSNVPFVTVAPSSGDVASSIILYKYNTTTSAWDIVPLYPNDTGTTPTTAFS